MYIFKYRKEAWRKKRGGAKQEKSPKQIEKLKKKRRWKRWWGSIRGSQRCIWKCRHMQHWHESARCQFNREVQRMRSIVRRAILSVLNTCTFLVTVLCALYNPNAALINTLEQICKLNILQTVHFEGNTENNTCRKLYLSLCRSLIALRSRRILASSLSELLNREER